METRFKHRIASQASFLVLALLGLILLAACDASTQQRVLNAGVAAQGDSSALQSVTPTVTGTPPTATPTVTGTPPTATATSTAGTPTATVTATAGTPETPGVKVTICHRTNSSSNPYVLITVAEPALPAHQSHGDLIPAPAGGCPSTWQTATPSASGTAQATRTVAAATTTAQPSMTATPMVTGTVSGTAGAKVTLCHATSSAKNPYVLITVDQSALPAHQKHGDIIPAPAGGCPQPTAGPAKNTQPKANQAPQQNTQKKVTKPAPAKPKVNQPAQPQNNGQQNKPAEKEKPEKPEKGGGKK